MLYYNYYYYYSDMNNNLESNEECYHFTAIYEINYMSIPPNGIWVSLCTLITQVFISLSSLLGNVMCHLTWEFIRTIISIQSHWFYPLASVSHQEQWWMAMKYHYCSLCPKSSILGYCQCHYYKEPGIIFPHAIAYSLWGTWRNIPLLLERLIPYILF